MMKMKTLVGALAAAGLAGWAVNAQADPVFVTDYVAPDPDGFVVEGTNTQQTSELGYITANFQATSVFQNAAVAGVDGATVIDQFTSGGVSFISGFENLDGNGQTIGQVGANWQIDWNLVFDYALQGTAFVDPGSQTGTYVDYDGGAVTVFADSTVGSADGEIELFQLIPTRTIYSNLGFFLDFELDFSGADTGADFFWSDDLTESWREIAADGRLAVQVAIADSNNAATAAPGVCNDTTDPGGFGGDTDLCRTGELNLSLRFVQVPEPGTLALLAMGLMGAGASARRRRKA